MRGHHSLFIIHEAANLNARALTIREERTQIGLVTLIKLARRFIEVKILKPTHGFLKKNDVPTI